VDIGSLTKRRVSITLCSPAVAALLLFMGTFHSHPPDTLSPSHHKSCFKCSVWNKVEEQGFVMDGDCEIDAAPEIFAFMPAAPALPSGTPRAVRIRAPPDA
jgi:hypothetical protein